MPDANHRRSGVQRRPTRFKEEFRIVESWAISRLSMFQPVAHWREGDPPCRTAGPGRYLAGGIPPNIRTSFAIETVAITTRTRTRLEVPGVFSPPEGKTKRKSPRALSWMTASFPNWNEVTCPRQSHSRSLGFPANLGRPSRRCAVHRLPPMATSISFNYELSPCSHDPHCSPNYSSTTPLPPMRDISLRVISYRESSA